MKWAFWRRDPAKGPEAPVREKVKLGRPGELPQQVGQYLVLRERMDPDWVWGLRCVLRPRGQRKSSFDFRVFSPRTAEEAGLTVRDYTSLEAHPQIVLFHGWFDKISNAIELFKGAPEKAA